MHQQRPSRFNEAGGFLPRKHGERYFIAYLDGLQ